jgi:hypothetical protein
MKKKVDHDAPFRKPGRVPDDQCMHRKGGTHNPFDPPRLGPGNEQDVAALQCLEAVPPADDDEAPADHPVLQDLNGGSKRVIAENPDDQVGTALDVIGPVDEFEKIVQEGRLGSYSVQALLERTRRAGQEPRTTMPSA